jgi:hypothetical protein
MRTYLWGVLSVFLGISLTRSEDLFREAVANADKEAELLKSTNLRFRKIAAKLKPVFRD